MTQPLRKKFQRGVSMIEIMVTVLVLSVGLLGLAALQGFSLQANQGAYHRTQAINVGYEITDVLRTNRSNPGGVDLGFWEDRITQHLPGGELDVDIDEPFVTVTITWRDDRLDDEPGGGETVVIATQL